jgi:hypothetical protein
MPYHHYSFAFTSNSQGSGSSRLFWFLLGGIAATVLIKIRERQNLPAGNSKGPRALPEPSPLSSDGARLRDRLGQMNAETSAAVRDNDF